MTLSEGVVVGLSGTPLECSGGEVHRRMRMRNRNQIPRHQRFIRRVANGWGRVNGLGLAAKWCISKSELELEMGNHCSDRRRSPEEVRP